jgi:hypothetical protein
MIGPNEALADAVFAALKPHLGRYVLSGVDKGPAFFLSQTGALPLAEGLPNGYTAIGIEGIFGTFPETYDGRYEMGDFGIKGVAHYPLVIKAWERNSSTWPAHEAIVSSFPLMTTDAVRRARLTPGSDQFVESLTLFIPFLIN